MTFDQIAILGLLLCMFIAYALERFRVEVIALTGLAAAFLLGLVPVQELFSGFSSPAVMTVVEILLIVSVLARTRAIERFADVIVARLRNEHMVLAVLSGSGALLSIFMNNIGALALMFPVTLSACARLRISSGRMLMPLSFATLLGGMCSLTGTPANLIVNDWNIAQTGGGFGYFEIGLVGAPVAVAGLIWLSIAAPRTFRHMREAPLSPDPGPSEFLTELRVGKGSPLAGQHLVRIEQDHGLRIHDVLRQGVHVFARREAIVIAEGDLLLAESDIETVETLRADGAVVLDGLGEERLEVVLMPDSTIIGSRVDALESFAEQGVTILALSSRRRRIEGRFGDLQLGLGDVLILSGERAMLREVAAEAGLLPLSPRAASHAHPDAYKSAAVFAVGIVTTALGFAPPEIAFGGVVIAMALLGSLRLRPALQDVNWTIIILLACMIPLGVAVQDSGAARVIANHIVSHLPTTEPMAVTALVLVLAAAITPFVDNVSTAAVLSPIAAGISTRTGVPVEPLLIAVAIGASLDFLTPFGHHNNTVVMGAAGYRFTDFPRLGIPLLIVCILVAVAALRFLWL